MTFPRSLALLWLNLVLTLVVAAWAGDPGPVESAAEGYLRDVKPVLARRCYACHGALKKKAGLRLDTGAGIREGGDGGPAVEPGHADESLLIDRLGENVVTQGGLKVYTTLDSNLQDQAQKIVSDEIEKLKPLHVGNGSALITNPKTGEVETRKPSPDESFVGLAFKCNAA